MTLESNTYWISFKTKWRLNDGIYRLGVSRSFSSRNYLTYLAENYGIQTNYGIGYKGTIGKGDRSCSNLVTKNTVQ
jgi:hypothetical protein